MSLSLYEASAPVYVRMLNNLDHFFAKAEAHAAATGADLQAYSDARLAPDMHPLHRQVWIATDAAKGGAARLSGQEVPSYPDVETTFPQLRERIARTIAFVQSIPAEAYEGREDAPIELPLPNGLTLKYTARQFLTAFTLPNFLFHVTTAYAILRVQGVPLGKLDYLAGGAMPG